MKGVSTDSMKVIQMENNWVLMKMFVRVSHWEGGMGVWMVHHSGSLMGNL